MAEILKVLYDIAWGIVQIATFFQRRLWQWWCKQSPRDILLDNMHEARLFEEWEAAASSLDRIMDHDLWRSTPRSRHYSHRLIQERLTKLYKLEDEGDITDLVSYLRSGLVRNLGNILAPKLYNRAYHGTKHLIEEYILQVVRCVGIVTLTPTTEAWTSQWKLDTLHDTRQAFGRSALVLQGGSIFGLCHLGVVRALHLQGLLPRIIAGTATGALMAALVCVHTEDELVDVLSGEGINMDAFAQRDNANGFVESKWYSTLIRRTQRWWRTGHFLDVEVLEELLKANIGDITFQEAYDRTKRILNITVTTNGGGAPTLLNYVTAPYVLIWSAALASNATSSSTLYHPVTLYCRDYDDNIVPWPAATNTTFASWTHASYRDRQSPLHRLSELFNVNHFVVSQARPYLAPFLRSDTHHPHPKQFGPWRLTIPILRLVLLEVQHRLQQLDRPGLLSPSIRRFLLDEQVPGASLTIVPELSPSDFFKLLEHPTKEAVDYWIRKGERSVWPAITALKVRLAIEFEIDRGYQRVRRRRNQGHSRIATGVGGAITGSSQGEVRNGTASSARTKSSEQLDRRRSAGSVWDSII